MTRRWQDAETRARLKLYADAVDEAFAADAPDLPSVYDIAERVITVADGEQSDLRASLAFWKRRAHEMEQDRNRFRELNDGAVSTRNRVTGEYGAHREPSGDHPASLTEFLLARIVEDETDAGGIECFGVDFLEMYKRRALAECEAMRAIVARHSEHLGLDRSEDYRNDCDTLRHLAAVYADHPDYDEVWRP